MSKKSKDGAALIAAERERQINAEGWTAIHDDMHCDEQLPRAAACYATDGLVEIAGDFRELRPVVWALLWPFEKKWWKPSKRRTRNGRIRELVKAGAMIAAEIDRLHREQEESCRVNRMCR